MMRVLVVLLSITSAWSQAPAVPDDAVCALDSARAVDDVMDALVYVFASIERCNPQAHDQIRCTLDVSAAIESVNKMVNIIVRAVDKCGAITTAKPDCGIAIGQLTRSMATLTSASAGIVAKCPNKANGGHPLWTVGEHMANAARNEAASIGNEVGGGFSNSFGQCVIDVKDSVKSLFKTIKRTMVLSDVCQPGGGPSDACAFHAIMVVDGLVGLAEYISGAVAKCSMNVKDSVNAGCAQMSARLVHATGEVTGAGGYMSHACSPTAAERLYLDGINNKKSEAAPATNSLTFALAGFLPVTAVIAFVGGKRMARVRAMAVPEPDEEMLVQSE